MSKYRLAENERQTSANGLVISTVTALCSGAAVPSDIEFSSLASREVSGWLIGLYVLFETGDGHINDCQSLPTNVESVLDKEAQVSREVSVGLKGLVCSV
ncbi:hypothetical protein CEXT_567771 [Caerostris extrusa]|uniref:Uncharacterized protein n=1 Tax=Caerostris extrusa TaxID=172846 RepID=A0AAV4T2Z0_CAEEX|nr:hypothetical protein CEXT_567771 [Caerostris extrusa]